MVLTEEFFVAWHDRAIEFAKKTLKDEGKLHQMAIVLTLPGLVDISLHKNLMTFEGEFGVLKDVPPTELAELLVPSAMPEGVQLKIIYDHMLNEEGRERMAILYSVGKQAGLPDQDFEKHTLNALKKVLGIDETQIFRAHLLDIIKKTQALGSIFISETYVSFRHVPAGSSPQEEAKSFKGRPSEDPNSREAIVVSLECDMLLRTVMIPFTRTERDVGEVTGFDEPQEMRSQPNAREKTLDGRMMNLREKAGLATPPATKS